MGPTPAVQIATSRDIARARNLFARNSGWGRATSPPDRPCDAFRRSPAPLLDNGLLGRPAV